MRSRSPRDAVSSSSGGVASRVLVTSRGKNLISSQYAKSCSRAQSASCIVWLGASDGLDPVGPDARRAARAAPAPNSAPDDGSRTAWRMGRLRKRQSRLRDRCRAPPAGTRAHRPVFQVMRRAAAAYAGIRSATRRSHDNPAQRAPGPAACPDRSHLPHREPPARAGRARARRTRSDHSEWRRERCRSIRAERRGASRPDRR